MTRLKLFAPALLLLLSACGGSGSSATVTCDQQFWNGTVSACLPTGWKVISQDQLTTLGVPEETVAAFQLETPHAGQLDTVTVTREPLTQDLDTTEYSKSSVLAVSVADSESAQVQFILKNVSFTDPTTKK